MQYTIDQLYDHLHQKVDAVYEVFKNFFGEDYVDLHKRSALRATLEVLLSDWEIPWQKNAEGETYEISEGTMFRFIDYLQQRPSYIYVWWPQVTVTNENHKSINIQDLYARVTIQLDGRIPYEHEGFLLNRATYTETQFRRNYLHSHIKCIPKDCFKQFQAPCLGTGPIAKTILTLKTENDESFWMLFCQELSMYVTVESLAGVPWRKLEEVTGQAPSAQYCGINDFVTRTPRFFEDIQPDFIKYYLQHGHLSLSFLGNIFQCGMSYCAFIVDISNCFIEWYNQAPKEQKKVVQDYKSTLLSEVYIAGGIIYNPRHPRSIYSLDNYRGKPVLTFKGKEICVSIIPDQERETTPSLLLDNTIASNILRSILKVINYRYETRHNNPTSEPRATSACKRVCYL